MLDPVPTDAATQSAGNPYTPPAEETETPEESGEGETTEGSDSEDEPAVAARTHFNVSVHSFDIPRRRAPILLERPDGMVLRCFDVNFGDARIVVQTRLNDAEKLQRSGPTAFSPEMNAAAVWMTVEPGTEELLVVLEHKGPMRPLSKVGEFMWIRYADVPKLGC